jgi:hypothetical protein
VAIQAGHDKAFAIMLVGLEQMLRRKKMSRTVWSYFDPLSMVVIVLTLLLFGIALFVKGFTHELLQECGVFLVSVKLIMMSHKNAVSARVAEERLAKIQDLLQDTREHST